MKFFKIFIIIICLYASFLFAQEQTLRDYLSISDEEISKIRDALPKLEEDKIFYHWTQPNTGIRWIGQGKLDAGELDFLNRPTGDRQVYGPGLYLAESPTSSSNFGDMPTVFKIKKGTPIYDDGIVTQILGRRLNSIEKSALGTYIPFVRHATDDWYLTNHVENVQEIVYAGVYDVHFKINQLKKTADFFPILWDGVRQRSLGLYAESFIQLSYYQDGVAFVANVMEDSSNPWRFFEPDNFEKHRQAFSEIIANSQSDHFKDMGLQSKGNFGHANLDAKEWAKTQIEEVLPNINKKVSGNSNAAIRLEGIRAGGPEAGGQFIATNTQLGNMLANPYIEVEYVRRDANSFFVNYFYPDAFHYKKLKGKISDALYTKLSKADHNQLIANTALRQKYNRQIIEELLEDLFQKYHGTNVNILENKETVQFMQDMISIHPFADFNGRTVRLYFQAANLQAGNPAIFYFINDFDLTTSSELYRVMLKQSSELHQKFRIDMLEEYLMARSTGKNMDPLKLEGFKNLDQSFSIFGIDKDYNFSAHDRELLNRRNFVSLLDENVGTNWQYLDLEGLPKAVAFLPASDGKDLLKIFEKELPELMENPYFASSLDNFIQSGHFISKFNDDQAKRLIPFYRTLLNEIPISKVEKGFANTIFPQLLKAGCSVDSAPFQELIKDYIQKFEYFDSINTLLTNDEILKSKSAEKIFSTYIATSIEKDWKNINTKLFEKMASNPFFLEGNGLDILQEFYRKETKGLKDLDAIVSEILKKNPKAWDDPRFREIMDSIVTRKETFYYQSINPVLLSEETLKHPKGIKFFERYFDLAAKGNWNNNDALMTALANNGEYFSTPEGLKTLLTIYEKNPPLLEKFDYILGNIFKNNPKLWDEPQFAKIMDMVITRPGTFYYETVNPILLAEETWAHPKGKAFFEKYIDLVVKNGWKNNNQMSSRLRTIAVTPKNKGLEIVLMMYEKNAPYLMDLDYFASPYLTSNPKAWDDPSFQKIMQKMINKKGEFYYDAVNSVLFHPSTLANDKGIAFFKSYVDRAIEKKWDNNYRFLDLIKSNHKSLSNGQGAEINKYMKEKQFYYYKDLPDISCSSHLI